MVSSNYELEEMTWPEAKVAISEADFVFISIGSIEQHSHHLPLKTDSVVTYEVSKRIAQKANGNPKILIGGKVFYGFSEHHMHFPGTITLKQKTLGAVVSDICECLYRHGAKRIVFINGHAGNRPILDVIAPDLQRQFGIPILEINWFSFSTEVTKSKVKSEFWSHSCEAETSVVMYLFPNDVRKEKIIKPKVNSPYIDIPGLEQGVGMFNLRNLSPVRYWEDYTDTGAIGDPTLANTELGREMVETAIERIIAALQAYLKKFG